jgi:hypothetical protein
VFITSIFFSQTDKVEFQPLNHSFFDSNIEERHYLLNRSENIKYKFEELLRVDFPTSINNSEGKFATYDRNLGTFLNASNEIKTRKVFHFSQEKIRQENIYSMVADMTFNKKTSKDYKEYYAIAQIPSNRVEIMLGGLKTSLNRMFIQVIDLPMQNSLNLLIVNM